MRQALAAAAGTLALVGAAWAAGANVSVKGRGTAAVSWNPVTYREELMAQLAPGLTWRLGREEATRLDLRKMALVCPAGGVLLPAEQTLNLRYWSAERWELVVFAENRWNWGEDVTELGVFPASVGRQGDEAKQAKSLDLRFRQTTRGEPTPIPSPAVTGGDQDLMKIFEVPDDVPYPTEQRLQYEALPLLELQMAFGPYVGTVGFEPVTTSTLKGQVSRDEGEPLALRMETLELSAPGVRATYLEEHEGEIPVGVLFAEGLPAQGVVVVISGGELPLLYTRTRSGADSDVLVEGIRETAQLRKTPTTVRSALDGSRLQVIVAPWAYTFDLAAVVDE